MSVVTSSSASSPMAVVISKGTIARLLKDVKQILREPLVEQGIYYSHSDSDMLKGYALIVGPEGTPYFGGSYFFEFTFPADYPHSPPKVRYCTNGFRFRFNPNLYTCGKVCVSLLNTWKGEQWTSCQTISTVLLNLCTLLCENPLLNEPSVTIAHPDMATYNILVSYANFKVAIAGVLRRDPEFSYSATALDIFYPVIIERFRKNYAKLYEIAKKGRDEIQRRVYKTPLYGGMQVIVDFERVVTDLESLITFVGENSEEQKEMEVVV